MAKGKIRNLTTGEEAEGEIDPFMRWLKKGFEEGQYPEEDFTELTSSMPYSYLKALFPEIKQFGPNGRQIMQMNSLMKNIADNLFSETPDPEIVEAFKEFVENSRVILMSQPKDATTSVAQDIVDFVKTATFEMRAPLFKAVKGGFFSSTEFNQLRRIVPLSIELCSFMVETPMTAVMYQDLVIGVGTGFTERKFEIIMHPWWVLEQRIKNKFDS